MLSALLIVFREVIEAGLIVGIVLAASKGVRRRVLWVAYGAGKRRGFWSLFCCRLRGRDRRFVRGFGTRTPLNASILLLAVVMLTWH